MCNAEASTFGEWVDSLIFLAEKSDNKEVLLSMPLGNLKNFYEAGQTQYDAYKELTQKKDDHRSHYLAMLDAVQQTILAIEDGQQSEDEPGVYNQRFGVAFVRFLKRSVGEEDYIREDDIEPPVCGKFYKHFKHGHTYKVLHLALHTETETQLVIHRRHVYKNGKHGTDGQILAKPLHGWGGWTDPKNGKPRFEQIEILTEDDSQ